MADWKNFLKGFYDTYNDQLHIVVIGSAKLDVYKKGGDSLLGRYFLYHQYPLTIGEYLKTKCLDGKEITPPLEIDDKKWTQLFEFGGFPEPFLKKDPLFSNQWQRLKHQQLFREDLRDFDRIREIEQCELLATMMQERAGQLVNYSQLSKLVRASDYSIRKWLGALKSLYYCFFIRPWSKNISRSLIKEPKCYLWDWATISDPGMRIENFVACHLFKAVSLWTDIGLGSYELSFIRDKDKNEVDFLITKNNIPWILIEVKKSSNTSITSSLYKFQKALGVKHTFQLAFDMPYINQDCFLLEKPTIVPMKTFLSQLV
ncbi:MAG: DUF4143 domain-containing protein [Gammaproteobacteria bacterium]|nr:DUF4143 domain-containing protein [Gammaproteobacteria bacterium]